MNKKQRNTVALVLGALGFAGVVYLIYKSVYGNCNTYPIGLGAGDKACEKPAVKTIQKWINTNLPANEAIPVNGKFDQATENALYQVTNESWKTVNEEMLNSMIDDLKKV